MIERHLCCSANQWSKSCRAKKQCCGIHRQHHATIKGCQIRMWYGWNVLQTDSPSDTLQTCAFPISTVKQEHCVKGGGESPPWRATRVRNLAGKLSFLKEPNLPNYTTRCSALSAFDWCERNRTVLSSKQKAMGGAPRTQQSSFWGLRRQEAGLSQRQEVKLPRGAYPRG